MADQKVRVYFEVDGLKEYVGDLNDLKRALGDADGATKEMNDSTSDLEGNLDRSRDKIQGFKGAVDILGGSVEALVGGLGLLGAQPQWLESIEDGATKAIAFADGISRLADGVSDVREYMVKYTAATKANTVAIEAQDVATKATTVSTRTLSTVLKGAGIGLIIAGLAAVVANWDKILNTLGFTQKKFDTSIDETIRKLELQQRINNIQGQTAVEAANTEAELARLRAKRAVDYLAYLEETGAEEEEINKAREESVQLIDDYNVAIVAAEQATKDFNEEQLRLRDEIIANDPNIYGTPAYFEEVAVRLRELTDAEFESLNFRLSQNTILTDKLLEESEARYATEKALLDKQLADGVISRETYNTAIESLDRKLAAEQDKIRQDSADKETEITQQTWNRRMDLAAQGVQALIAINEATAGASEAEQRKAFERNKKLQIGLATVQTAQAVTAALTAGGNPVKLATGAQFVEAAIAAATGLAQIVAIKKQTFDGGGTIPTPTPNASTSINYSFGQQAGATIQPGQLSTGEQPQPQQVYVLASDVTNAQQAQQQINNLAKL